MNAVNMWMFHILFLRFLFGWKSWIKQIIDTFCLWPVLDSPIHVQLPSKYPVPAAPLCKAKRRTNHSFNRDESRQISIDWLERQIAAPRTGRMVLGPRPVVWIQLSMLCWDAARVILLPHLHLPVLSAIPAVKIGLLSSKPQDCCFNSP